MNQVSDLLGQRYEDLRASSILGPDMPEAELIGDQSYVSLPEQGMSLVLPDNERVGTIQLYAAGHEGFSQFDGDVPSGIAFAIPRSEVRKQLGAPVLCGERQSIPVLGEKPAWDSYLLNGIRMHIEYSLQGESVQLISLTPA
jgi:hypothetical protein